MNKVAIYIWVGLVSYIVFFILGVLTQNYFRRR